MKVRQAIISVDGSRTMKTDVLLSPLIPWQELSLREQVSQLLVMHGSKCERGLPREDGPLEAFLERYPIGSIFMGGEVIEDGSNEASWVRGRAEQVRERSRIPLLVAADLENGVGDVIPGLTPLPFPMALGAANDEQLAYDYGRASALEGALAGINWALAPMADLNLHPLSSNVGTRAFGDDARRVIPLLGAFVRGLQDAGMAACAKTFPGDGSDYRDQHLVRTVNRLGLADWWKSYGAVFQSLIDADVATVMTGHLAFPAYQKYRESGRALPATICPELTTKLLKEEMGFRGAVCTDAFGMGGIRNQRDAMSGAVEAFAAGADLFLWPDYTFVDRVIEQLESGTIPMSRLEDALTRIWRLKERFGATIPEDPSATELAESVAQRTAKGCLTQLWNHESFLPLNPVERPRILMIATTHYEKAFGRFSILRDELVRRGFSVEFVRNITPEALEKEQEEYDCILVCIDRQFHRPLGPMELFGEEARNLWSACMHGREKTVAIGFGSPYLVPNYFETAPAAINAYSKTTEIQRAVASALCGEADFPGTMPVVWEERSSITELGFLEH